MDSRNEEYLKGAFKQLHAAGFRTPDELKAIQDSFVHARDMLRQSLGSKYDSMLSDYKKIIQDTAHRFKINALMATDHCMKSLDSPTAPYMTDEEKDGSKALFMAAALDLIEPDIGRN
jgi:hypothetical protein